MTDHFRQNEEAVVVGDGRPMGIVTPKDALDYLPKKPASLSYTWHILKMGRTE